MPIKPKDYFENRRCCECGGIPLKEIIKHKSHINIYDNSLNCGWYEEFGIDNVPYSETYRNLDSKCPRYKSE